MSDSDSSPEGTGELEREVVCVPPLPRRVFEGAVDKVQTLDSCLFLSHEETL